MNTTFLKILDLARPYLNTRENEEHTRIACEFAERLLKAEGGDAHVVMPAVILHDVGWKSIPAELQITAFGPGKRDTALNRIHEQEGARIAADILKTVIYRPHLIEEIVAIVSRHDSMSEALSLNDAIVKDSDKLWRYSEHGVSLGVMRFEMSHSRYLDRLKNKLDKWFLTRTGESIAREQLNLRERCFEREA
jgi:HD superfamily phosphodiesterase